MSTPDVLTPLRPDECRLMPRELVEQFNTLAGALRTVQASIPRLARLVEELLGEMAFVRRRLQRDRYQIGFLGRTGVGKSTTFDCILNVVEDVLRRPSDLGHGESTTSVITRLCAHPDGDLGRDEMELRYITEERYRFKCDKVCEAVGLEPGLSDEEVLRRLPELESKIARGEKRALSEDPKYLRKLVSSHHSYRTWVGRQAEQKDYGELDANGKPKRFKYLNHDPNDAAPSPYMLLEDALIRFRTAEIHKELEIIDLPGLGAHVSIDTILSGEFLDDLDGALVFVSVKARSDEVAEKIIARLRELFRGDFGNRLWLVLTNFDSLGEEFVKGKGSSGDTGFDGVARLGNRFGVLDSARGVRQICLVSNHLFRYGEFENGRLRQRAAATAIGFPAEPAVPPQVEKYPDLVPAYQELFVDGGISWLRWLLREELVPLVSARLRDTIHARLRDVVRRLQPPLELARKHRGEDLLPDVQRCLEAVFLQVRSLESRTDVFDQPVVQLRGELDRQFKLRFAAGEFNDARPLADIQQRFPGDAQALEDCLAEQFRMRIVPDLYAVLGTRLQQGVEKLQGNGSPGRLQEGNGPLDIPIASHPGVLQAWEAFGQEDAGQLASWAGKLFPTFVDPRLFAGMQPRDAEQLNGKSYRALMQEKVKVSSAQAMHVLRARLVQRLKQLEQALDDLTKIDAETNGSGTSRVDYDELLNKLRSLCPST